VPEPEGDRAAALRGLGADRRRRQRGAHQGQASEAKEIATSHVRPPCHGDGNALARARPSRPWRRPGPLWRPETACREASAGPSTDRDAVYPVATRVQIAGADREL